MKVSAKSRVFGKLSEAFALFQIIPRVRRGQAVLQLVLQCVSNFFEIMVLGLIVPLVAIVNDPGMIQRSHMLQRAYNAIGATTPSEFILYFGSALLLLLLLRAALSIWSNRRLRRLCADISTELGSRVLDRILHMPYLEHARTNSSVLQRLVTSDVERAGAITLVTTFIIFSELFSTCTVLLGLVVVKPSLMLPLILFLCAGAFSVYRLTKAHLTQAGDRMRHEQATMNKWVLQSLGDVRYARLVGSEKFFVTRVDNAWRNYALASQSSTAIQQSTRIYVETGALGSVVLMVMYFVGASSGTQILTVLGLLAVATVRLVPSINRVINGAQVLDHIRSSVTSVIEVLRQAPALPQKSTGQSTVFSNSLEFRNVSFSYPGGAKPALSNLSLRINNGEMIGIVGPSGAGKSTIIDLLCGLIPPDTGQVLVDGRDVQLNLRDWQSLIGYVPQTVFLLDDSIRANVAYGIAEQDIDDDSVQQALETAALGEFVAGLPDGSGTNVGERGVALSGGQRQRIAIARALYRNAPILVLDEATSALDSATEREITETLHNIYGKKTIIVIAHRLNTVVDSNRIYVLNDGRLEASGTFQELQANNALFRQIGALA